ncbi:DUF3592 domain-containing protein [Thermophilibacter provencensis]|uniref:DUF3592 domain-containing protein n=1 Tax=Thermophilibacter provencensis TaxID=1852386 RepID=A0ABT7V3X9_9ACTN|nr:DUF3592 domain-containing protein [Thermophilibacter provencensis]MDM8271298.1 DUF3592 domain-containing protein [Thermophilibacter provencensis]
MSDGIMILLIFGLIAVLGGGTTALVLLVAKRVRARKEQTYSGSTTGTVVRVRPGSTDRPTVVYVRYVVDGTAYECHETVKLTSEPIKLGPVPVGQRKRGKIPSSVGSEVRVAYLPADPSKAILADNGGLMNV